MDGTVVFNCLFFIFIDCGLTSGQLDVDKSRYDDGRREYELMVHRSEMPRYGTCWKDAMMTIQNGCKQLTDDVQGRLSLAYLNCFLEFQGRDVYECDADQPFHECAKNMLDVDRGSFTTFFTHTQNICYFLQAQVWHEETENTIGRLSDSSSQVASKLEDSYKLQNQVLKQQEESIKNQEMIMDKASNLSNIISASSDDIHVMFADFKETTQEQRLLITDVFDRVAKLQHMVLGEFSGFYSIVFYTLSILVSYLLTSTARTSSARFWLFGLMTSNMIVEQMIVSIRPGFFRYIPFQDFENEEEMIYGSQRLVRRVSGLIGFFILCFSVYNFQDLNTINNQLLVEIRRQNSELRHCLMGTTSGSSSDTKHMITQGKNGIAADSTTVDSDSAVSSGSTGSEGEDSDHTFILQSSSHSESSHSYFSVMTESLANTQMSTLHSELRDLRQSTPIKQLPDRVAAWVKTGFYPVSPAKAASSSTIAKESSLEAPRYYLRPRKPIPGSPNPALNVESPNSFSKTVRHLEQITRKNSILARAVLRQKKHLPDSSDED
ncbi:uncharacterized protein LOC124136351 isoform X2 [Haliotis rufescens]|uniref:uncharacterized protein LOC124136351 isoform X2 n=1 Tax=Haliotis rufescens TaxID=6454 RepID=UPI00201ED3DA|nr:uncharacterized protein LOC124136351 isoform X2 [Haliotis rufescens]